MKRIVILCDGTWKTSDTPNPTNVVRLAQLMGAIDPEGIVQVPIYIRGVGSGVGSNWFARQSDRILGGALGWGLMNSVMEAYRHLVFLYEPGDEIFIFGFSRGAFAARSLAGFIRSTGIVSRDNLHMIRLAEKRYRARGQRSLSPRSDESHEFRALTMWSRVATSEAEQTWRSNNEAPEVPLLRIKFLGVWDTVESLGIPESVPVLGRVGAFAQKWYRFHDGELSSMVGAARHALALDERRRTFSPNTWSNLQELNAQCSEPGAMPYREQYFAGDHGAVGGGGEVRDLSSIALAWVVEGAQYEKLYFPQKRVEDVIAEGNPLGPLTNTKKPRDGIMDKVLRLFSKDRAGPTEVADVHVSAIERFHNSDYDPPSLARVREALLARK